MQSPDITEVQVNQSTNQHDGKGNIELLSEGKIIEDEANFAIYEE